MKHEFQGFCMPRCLIDTGNPEWMCHQSLMNRTSRNNGSLFLWTWMRLKIRFTKWIIDNWSSKNLRSKEIRFSPCQLPVFFSSFASSCEWISETSFQVLPPPKKKTQHGTWKSPIWRKENHVPNLHFCVPCHFSVYYRRSSSLNPQPNPPPMQRSDHLLRNEAQWQFFFRRGMRWGLSRWFQPNISVKWDHVSGGENDLK